MGSLVSTRSRESEAVNRTQMQLQEATDAYQLSLKLEKSKACIKSLQHDVTKLQSLVINIIISDLDAEKDVGRPSEGELEESKARIQSLQHVTSKLQNPFFDSMMNELQAEKDAGSPKGDVEAVNVPKETVEKLHSGSEKATDGCASLLLELKQSEAQIQSLKEYRLLLFRRIVEGPKPKEKKSLKTKLDELSESASELELEVMKAASVIAKLKASIPAQRMKLESVADRLKMVKMKIEAMAMAEAARAAEREALLEADKSKKHRTSSRTA